MESLDLVVGISVTVKTDVMLGQGAVYQSRATA